MTTNSPILEFRGVYRFLSNFYEAAIRINGLTYPTVEHAFAAFKSTSPEVRRTIAALATPGEAKQAGRHLVLREGWESVKGSIMHRLVDAKFRQHGNLAAQLLATGTARLVEGNDWNDRIWGVDRKTGLGENRLGETLMSVRSELRQRQRGLAHFGYEICAAFSEQGLNDEFGCSQPYGHGGNHGDVTVSSRSM